MNKETSDTLVRLMKDLAELKKGNVTPINVSKDQYKCLESLLVAYMTAASEDSEILMGELDKVWNGFIKEGEE